MPTQTHPLRNSRSGHLAATQALLLARNAVGGSRELGSLHWGLIPHWAKEPKTGYSIINARAETVADKPTFRNAFRHSRCLIAADGYNEWRQLDRAKQPYFIGLKDREPFAFAGLWEHWAREGQSVNSCALTAPEAMVRAGLVRIGVHADLQLE